jgi:hypothetical protein
MAKVVREKIFLDTDKGRSVEFLELIYSQIWEQIKVLGRMASNLTQLGYMYEEEFSDLLGWHAQSSETIKLLVASALNTQHEIRGTIELLLGYRRGQGRYDCQFWIQVREDEVATLKQSGLRYGSVANFIRHQLAGTYSGADSKRLSSLFRDAMLSFSHLPAAAHELNEAARIYNISAKVSKGLHMADRGARDGILRGLQPYKNEILEVLRGLKLLTT